jgi:hypothetical protein
MGPAFQAFWLYSSEGETLIIPYIGFIETEVNGLKEMNAHTTKDFLMKIGDRAKRAHLRNQRP